MRKYIKRILLLSFLVVSSVIALFFFEINNDHMVISEQPEDRLYNNLEAFGKIYGYVRFFHPSDESAELDWNRFAIYGVSKVKKAKSENELKVILKEVFLPIAPTMKLYHVTEKSKFYKSTKDNGEFVAWQHYGYGLGTIGMDDYIYKSERVSAVFNKGKYTLDNEKKLFHSFPQKAEILNGKITKELVCSIPLALIKDKSGTLGSNKSSLANYEKLKKDMVNMDPNTTSENENVRFAGIIVTWNVLNHFYPYFHVTNSDWENQLKTSLKDASDDKSRDEYLSSLSRLMEKTKDGHATLSFDQYKMDNMRLPFTMDIIEHNLVITEVLDDSPFKHGDIIESINGQNPIDLIEQMGKEIPGSPHFKKFKAITYIKDFNNAQLKIKRGHQVLDINVESKEFTYVDEFKRSDPFKEIDEGVYYVDLNKDVEKIFKENLESMIRAKGIIFDLRGYPYSSDFMEQVVGYLTDKPLKGPIWRIMETVYPNQQQVTFDEGRVDIQPRKPNIKGKVIFLSYAGSMSQPETYLGYVKDNRLATIVGQASAGSNGNAQMYSIPGNLTGIFTGMEWLNSDRSQVHMIGIEPDYTVNRTLEGAKKGEDEYIKKALEVINN